MPSDLEPRVTVLETAMVELARAQTQSEQRQAELNQRQAQLSDRLDEFIRQSARLLGDHGARLSRIEAGLESLLALAQASDRRLNRVEGLVASNAEAIRDLRAINQANEQRFAQLEVSQREVLSRMDDVIAVLRERL